MSLWEFLALIILVPQILKVTLTHLQNQKRLQVKAQQKELELEKLRNENFVLETEKMRLELEQMRLEEGKRQTAVLPLAAQAFQPETASFAPEGEGKQEEQLSRNL